MVGKNCFSSIHSSFSEVAYDCFQSNIRKISVFGLENLDLYFKNSFLSEGMIGMHSLKPNSSLLQNLYL